MEQQIITLKTDKGNEYQHVLYTDPYPENKGSDRIRFECHYCLGTGVYQGKSGLTFYTPAVGGVDKGCFSCNGTGQYTRLVSSLRAAERREVNRINESRANDADWNSAEATAEREEAARKEQEEADRAEAERLAGMTQGFIGEVGERIRNLTATVKVNYQFEANDFRTGALITKSLLIFQLEDGREAKWTTGVQWLEQGQKVSLTGTVKDHDNYKGQDQTVLTRCIVK